MKLATLRAGGRDGTLVVVSSDGQRHAPPALVAAAARTLQAALDDWAHAEPLLRAIAADLDDGLGGNEEADGPRLGGRARGAEGDVDPRAGEQPRARRGGAHAHGDGARGLVDDAEGAHHAGLAGRRGGSPREPPRSESERCRGSRAE